MVSWDLSRGLRGILLVGALLWTVQLVLAEVRLLTGRSLAIIYFSLNILLEIILNPFLSFNTTALKTFLDIS